MKRTERLHALTEEIRRRAPAPLSTTWLADRLGVSTRTIERDLAALRATGLPLQPAAGRRGGNALHPRAVLPPLNLTAAETTALLLALTITDGMPYSTAARSAANKLHALLPPATVVGVEHLSSRLRVTPTRSAATPRTLAVLEQAVTDSTAVRLRYVDRNDAATDRIVEPAGFYGTPAGGWAMAAWCRLRDDARLSSSTASRPPRPRGSHARSVTSMPCSVGYRHLQSPPPRPTARRRGPPLVPLTGRAGGSGCPTVCSGVFGPTTEAREAVTAPSGEFGASRTQPAILDRSYEAIPPGYRGRAAATRSPGRRLPPQAPHAEPVHVRPPTPACSTRARAAG